LLAHARAERWPVVHVRHIQESHLFNEKLPYSRFVEGFEPLAHEMVFTKSLYSCFSSPEFAEFMETTRQHLVYVMGFDAQRCCFSTLVDAAHRSMRLTFVADASLSRRTALGDEQQSHRWVQELMSIYADIADTRNIIGEDAAPSDVEAGGGHLVRAQAG
jgi:nicotinamidase-related amidase